MTHTHTPGPWELEHCRNEDGSKFITINGQGADGAWLADIQAGNIDGKPADVTEKHLANARLIAVAPSLLNALLAIKTQAEFSALAFPNAPGRGDLLAIARDARDAIAKATGKGGA